MAGLKRGSGGDVLYRLSRVNQGHGPGGRNIKRVQESGEDRSGEEGLCGCR